MYQKPSVWEKGQGAVEYALGLSLIAVVLIIVLGALYNVMIDQFRMVICDGEMNIECTVGIPVASIQRSCNGLNCTFNGTDSTDSNGSIVSYEWDFGDGANSTGMTASHTYSSDGTYTVTLVVTDNEGNTGSADRTVSVASPNLAPTASFTVSCTDLSCSFNGSASSDSDGSIASYTWDFGDGANATGATANHTYTSSGSRTVRLTVTDDGGRSASTTRTATPTAPPASVGHVADLDGTQTTSGNSWTATITITVKNGLDMAVNGATVAGSFNNGGGSGTCTTNASGICTITSSSVARTGGSAVTSLTFTVSGLSGSVSYSAAANADPDGDSNGTSITVSQTPNVPPTANFTVSCAALVCTFNGTSSTDSDGTISSYSWSFGDSATGTGSTITHSYVSAGTYSVTLTVTDNSSGTGTRTQSASPVANTPPTASFTVSCNALVCSVNASASTDSDGTITLYTWNFGDSTTGSGVTTSHTYTTAGSYTITLTARDNLGANGTTTRSVSPTTTATVVHIADLDGANAQSGNDWTATVTITVKDVSNVVFNGAIVTGSFNNGGGSGTCTTNASGICTIASSSVARTGGSAIANLTFTVSNITGSLTYNAAANTDPDGDSTGTSITVAKP